MMIALVQMVLYGMTTSRDVNGSQLHVALIAVMAIQVQIHLQLQMETSSDTDPPPNPCPCVSSCTGMPDGDYQSCNGCNVYVTCSNEIIHDDRPCPDGLVWDDNLKRCEWESTTCGTDSCDGNPGTDPPPATDPPPIHLSLCFKLHRYA